MPLNGLSGFWQKLMIAGALTFAPVLIVFAHAVVEHSPTPDMAVAPLVFNVATSALFLALLPVYAPHLERWAAWRRP